MEQKIDKVFFVAIITDRFLANSLTFLKICADVEQANEDATLNNETEKLKPMYAIIRDDVDWSEFQRFSWRKKWFFNNEAEFDNAWEEMNQDVDLWKKMEKIASWALKK